MSKILDYSPSLAPSPNVQTPRDIPDDYQHIQSTPASFGGLIGQAEEQGGARLEQGSSELNQAAQQIQTITNTTNANQATSQYVDKVNQLFYGDGTAGNPGLFATKGKDGLDKIPDAISQLKQTFNDVGGTLTNPAARNMFENEARRYMMAHEDQIFRFGQEKQKEYAEESNHSMIAASNNSAGVNYNNDTIAGADIDRATSGLVQNYELKYGTATDDIKANLRQQATTDNVENRVNGAIARGDYATAHSILNKYGPQANPLKYRELTGHPHS